MYKPPSHIVDIFDYFIFESTVDGITNYHRPFRFTSPGVDNGPNGCVTRDFLEGFSFTGESQIVAMIMNYEQYADTLSLIHI